MIALFYSKIVCLQRSLPPRWNLAKRVEQPVLSRSRQTRLHRLLEMTRHLAQMPRAHMRPPAPLPTVIGAGAVAVGGHFKPRPSGPKLWPEIVRPAGRRPTCTWTKSSVSWPRGSGPARGAGPGRGDGLLHVILDGTIIESDRCRGPVISAEGELIDLWYSGKANVHGGGNMQFVATFGGSRRVLPTQNPGRCTTRPLAHSPSRHYQPGQDRRHRSRRPGLDHFEHGYITWKSLRSLHCDIPGRSVRP